MSDIALNDSPASIVQQYLIDVVELFSDPKLAVDWPLFISSLPDTENLKGNIASIVDRVGISDGRLMRTGKNIIHPGLQITIRSIDYQEGWGKGTALVAAIEVIAGITILVNDTTYTIDNISMTTPFTAIGVEKGTKRRHLFTVNFIITVEGE